MLLRVLLDVVLLGPIVLVRPVRVAVVIRPRINEEAAERKKGSSMQAKTHIRGDSPAVCPSLRIWTVKVAFGIRVHQFADVVPIAATTRSATAPQRAV